MESEKQMILQKTRTKAFQTDLCFRVSIFIKQKKKQKRHMMTIHENEIDTPK